MTTDTPARPIRLHRFARSGHCHRVELLLTLLGLPFECVDVNLAEREQRSPRFLAINPFGQVPAIEDGAFALGDSNAILTYLAARYGGARWAPASPALAAEQQRWFSVAAGPLDAGPASARAHVLFGSPHPLAPAQQRAHALFRVMDAQLERRTFLLGDALSLADLANYAYTAHAPEGGIPLDDYPRLRAWLARVEATPGFIGMPWSTPPTA